jgi:dTDP-4-amino-4,6-dideoxygalactose transaminase
MTQRFPAPESVILAVQACLLDGSWATYDHERLDSFEKALAAQFFTSHALVTGSGTLALELALVASGVVPNTNVVLAAYDYPGNFLTVHALEAHPYLVDVDPSTGQMDTQALKATLDAVPASAVVVSHLHGGIADIATISALCQEKNVPLVEDCCQCPGATFQGKHLGSWGHAGVISFGGGKPISCGRGGALVTNNALVAQRARMQSLRGTRLATLSNMQLAALEPQLANLSKTVQRTAMRAHQLLEVFQKASVFKPVMVNDGEPGYYRLGLIVQNQTNRETIIERGKELDLPVDSGFRALHMGRSKSRFGTLAGLTGAEICGKNMLTLSGCIFQEDESGFERIKKACKVWASGC